MTTDLVNTTKDAKEAKQAYQELISWQERRERGEDVSVKKAQKALSRFYYHGDISSLTLALPYLLKFQGQPLTLQNHYTMEPMFQRKDIPPSMIFKNGRQTGKSLSLAAMGVLRSAVIDHFNQLFVAPLCEQIQRFSHSYVSPLIRHSPARGLLMGEGVNKNTRNNVFHRLFANESSMYFSYALTDAERVRGINASSLSTDEVQDMDPNLLPVLQETLSASNYKIKTYTGTAKTTDSAISHLFSDSSQAHWSVKCEACNHINIMGAEYDLIEMIQPQGVSCSKCGKLVDPKTGMFWHAYPDRKQIFPGFHVPQPALPMHYANANAWHELLDKRRKYSKAKFYNEVLGEECDAGTKLVSREALQRNCQLPWGTDKEQAKHYAKNGNFSHIVMGVDWGGGGAGQIRRNKGRITIEEGTPSFTHLAIAGFGPGGKKPDLIYAERLESISDEMEEAKYVLQTFQEFNCHLFAHDYGGAGSVRETMIVHAGFPLEKIVPFIYTMQPAKPIVVYHPPSNMTPRRYYGLDKGRSLAILCSAINLGMTRFPGDWEKAKDYLEEFMHLIEDRTERPGGSDVYRIISDPSKPCDFPHAFNYACFAHWHAMQDYPDLALQAGFRTQNTGVPHQGDLPMDGWS